MQPPRHLHDGDDDAMFKQKNGTGIDYNPYQILTGDYMGLLNGDKSTGGANSALFVDGESAGVMSFGGYVGWQMSPKMSLKGTIGYAAATDEPDDYDDDYGIEFGLSMGYKIMDNLEYQAHFGYFWADDFFKMGVNNKYGDNFHFDHSLTMTF